jgi:hypothetical protein
MYKVETVETWLALIPTLVDNGYTLFQTQYGLSRPEGAIWRFSAGPHEIEVVTHSQAVYDAVERFCREQR